MPTVEVKLPPNVRKRSLLDGTVAFYWEVQSKDRKKGCTLANEALGTDVATAIARATELNQLLGAVRRGDKTFIAPGTVKWLGRWFLDHPKVTKLAAGTQDDYKDAVALICSIPVGTSTFGDIPAKIMQARHADKLYEDVQWVEETDANGQPVKRRRLRTANLCMQVARRMWKLAGRAGLVSAAVNPFSAMDLESTDGEGAAEPATVDELMAFVAKADELGEPSVGTAALVAFHWLQRQVDVIGRLAWTHYRAGDSVRIRHNKTNRFVPMPLRDGAGMLFPEIEERLANTPKVGSLIIMSRAALPWSVNTFRHVVRDIADAAGLPHLSFASFRKGGFTELGDAEATDQEMMAAGGHKTREMLTVYSRQTSKQAGKAARKRRIWREIDETKLVQGTDLTGSGSTE